MWYFLDVLRGRHSLIGAAIFVGRMVQAGRCFMSLAYMDAISWYFIAICGMHMDGLKPPYAMMYDAM